MQVRGRRGWPAAIAIGLIVTALLIGPRPAPATAQATLSLVDALNRGLVFARFESNGSASGAAIVLSVERLVEEELVLTVPVGMVLLNPETGGQDMAVRALLGRVWGPNGGYEEVDLITIPGDGVYVFMLEAYCIEAYDDNPRDGQALTFDGMASGDLLAVLLALDAVPAADDDIRAAQAAIWAVTDDVPQDYLDDVGYALSFASLNIARAVIVAAGLNPADYQLFP